MWLTGNKIAQAVENGDIFITPYNADHINSNSYNYCLGNTIYRIVDDVIDLKKEDTVEEIVIPEEGYILQPNECYLGYTVEVFGSDKYASLLTGRSSIGRKFLTNHVTAGLVDQGFKGQITLEIIAQKPTRVYPNIKFGQIFWFDTLGEPLLYHRNSGKYMGQMGPTRSKITLDFE